MVLNLPEYFTVISRETEAQGLFFHRGQLYGLAQLLYCDQLNDIFAGGATKVEERSPTAKRDDSFILFYWSGRAAPTSSQKETRQHVHGKIDKIV